MLPYGFLQKLDEQLHPLPPPRPRTRRQKRLQAVFFIVFIGFLISLYLIPVNVVHLRKQQIKYQKNLRERRAAIEEMNRLEEEHRQQVLLAEKLRLEETPAPTTDSLPPAPTYIDRNGSPQPVLPGGDRAWRRMYEASVKRRGKEAVALELSRRSKEQIQRDEEAKISRRYRPFSVADLKNDTASNAEGENQAGTGGDNGDRAWSGKQQHVFSSVDYFGEGESSRAMKGKDNYISDMHVRSTGFPHALAVIAVPNALNSPSGQELHRPHHIGSEGLGFNASVPSRDVRLAIPAHQDPRNMFCVNSRCTRSYFYGTTADEVGGDIAHMDKNRERFLLYGYPKFADFVEVLEDEEAEAGSENKMFLRHYQVPRGRWKRVDGSLSQQTGLKDGAMLNEEEIAAKDAEDEAMNPDAHCVGSFGTRFTRAELNHFNRMLQSILFSSESMQYAVSVALAYFEDDRQLIKWKLQIERMPNRVDEQPTSTNAAELNSTTTSLAVYMNQLNTRVRKFQEFVLNEAVSSRIRADTEASLFMRDDNRGDSDVPYIKKWQELFSLYQRHTQAKKLLFVSERNEADALSFPSFLKAAVNERNEGPSMITSAVSLGSFLTSVAKDARFQSSLNASQKKNKEEDEQQETPQPTLSSTQQRKTQFREFLIDPKTRWQFAETNPLQRIENFLKEVLLRLILAHGVGALEKQSLSTDYSSSHLSSGPVTGSILAETDFLYRLVWEQRRSMTLNSVGGPSGSIQERLATDLQRIVRHLNSPPFGSPETTSVSANNSDKLQKHSSAPLMKSSAATADTNAWLDAMDAWSSREVAFLNDLLTPFPNKKVSPKQALRFKVAAEAYVLSRFLNHATLSTVMRYRHQLDRFVRYVVGKRAYLEILRSSMNHERGVDANGNANNNNNDKGPEGESLQERMERRDAMLANVARNSGWSTEEEHVEDALVARDLATVMYASSDRVPGVMQRTFAGSAEVVVPPASVLRGPVAFLSEKREEVIPQVGVKASEAQVKKYLHARWPLTGVASEESTASNVYTNAWKRFKTEAEAANPVSQYDYYALRYHVVSEPNPFMTTTCGGPINIIESPLSVVPEMQHVVNILMDMRAAESDAVFQGSFQDLLNLETNREMMMMMAEEHVEDLTVVDSLATVLSFLAAMREDGFGMRMGQRRGHLDPHAEEDRRRHLRKRAVSMNTLMDGGGQWCVCETVIAKSKDEMIARIGGKGGVSRLDNTVAIPVHTAVLSQERIMEQRLKKWADEELEKVKVAEKLEMEEFEKNPEAQKRYNEIVSQIEEGEKNGGPRPMQYRLEEIKRQYNVGEARRRYSEMYRSQQEKLQEENPTPTCEFTCQNVGTLISG